MFSKKEIIENILTDYDGLVVNTNWGEEGLFYNPEQKLVKGIYLMTFKEKDGKNDKSSHLDRLGVYRLNVGISKNSFVRLFGSIPSRPKSGGVIDLMFDFSKLDCILPHPIYAWMSWICVLNPSKETFEKLKPLINEGYNLAKEKYALKKI